MENSTIWMRRLYSNMPLWDALSQMAILGATLLLLADGGAVPIGEAQRALGGAAPFDRYTIETEDTSELRLLHGASGALILRAVR
jgi:hypothetical protein